MFQNSTRTDQAVNCTSAVAERHLTELRDCSGIPEELIAERGYRSISDAAELQGLGFADFQSRPGLLIPLHDTYGRNSRFALKPDQPRVSGAKIVKYEVPAGQAPIIDVPRACLSSVLSPVVDLFITEGVKKADAIAGTGRCTIALSGVDGWYTNPEHGGYATIQPVSDWEPIMPTLDGRICYLTFDSDAFTKGSVALALRKLANWLARQGSLTYIVHIPDAPDGSKQGADDYIARYGAEAFGELVHAAEPWGSAGMVRKQAAELAQLRHERALIAAALCNPNYDATERIIAVKLAFQCAARPGAHRITIDAPADRSDPTNPDRTGMAAELGFGRNTVSRALKVVCGDGGPFVKQTVAERNSQGEIRSHTLIASSAGGELASILSAVATHDPHKTTRHGGRREPRRCEECNVVTVRRSSDVCPSCGEVVHETPTPTHQDGALIHGPSYPPHSTYVRAPRWCIGRMMANRKMMTRARGVVVARVAGR